MCPGWGVWRIWAKPFQWISFVIWTQHSAPRSERTTGSQHWFLFVTSHSISSAHLCTQSSGMAYSEVWNWSRSGCCFSCLLLLWFMSHWQDFISVCLAPNILLIPFCHVGTLFLFCVELKNFKIITSLYVVPLLSSQDRFGCCCKTILQLNV